MKSHKFRLYPSKAVEQELYKTLEICRQAYNFFLGELNAQKVIDKSIIQGTIPDMKICDSRYKQVYSKTLQYEVYRLFSNLSALTKSKQERKVGGLRFKGKNWFKTFTYNQSGFKLLQTGKRHQTLKLSKIGEIPIRCHRQAKGKIKQVTIKREPTGKWFAYIITDEQKQKQKQETKLEKIVGIDVGLKDVVYDSDGHKIKNPRTLKHYADALAFQQKKLAKTKKGSKNRLRHRLRVAKIYEKIVNTRNDFLHKISYYFVSNYDAIAMEDMPMTLEKDIFAKSKSDVAWGKLRQMIAYKAESAGKLFMLVPTKGTTQRCSQCGTIVPKDLSVRVHNCPKCGFVAPRDYNSALEIKRLMLNRIGQGLPESTPVEMMVASSMNQEALSLEAG